MNILERIEHWFNCRKIELSHWLEDSSFSYYTSWNPEKETYQTVKLSPYVKTGTPEAEAQLKMIDAIREREKMLCALDPAYKAAIEKKHAAYIARAKADYENAAPK